MTPEIIVQLREASKVYRMGEVDVVALKPTNLEVRFGEFVVVLGPSGCGKTTLMNLIGGLDSPTSGKVEIAGRDIGALNAAELTLFRRE
ncbi:MAG TPA: ATP-binding cassette domain-containing protein, partial [Fimbriimonadaceae bacterium]|nr:ATP-binding cassette domain-containing protein [Fimbriimonadaceae bacterium]